jgi:hypothetical protein
MELLDQVEIPERKVDELKDTRPGTNEPWHALLYRICEGTTNTHFSLHQRAGRVFLWGDNPHGFSTPSCAFGACNCTSRSRTGRPYQDMELCVYPTRHVWDYVIVGTRECWLLGGS